MRYKLVVSLLIVLVLVGVGSLVGLGMLYIRVATGGYRDDAVASDAIVVLGAAVWPGGEPSPALRGRVVRAVELYHQGYAPYLVLSGGVGGDVLSEAEVMRQVAATLGVPDEAMILDEGSYSTQDSSRNAAVIAEERGWTSVIVVSDPFHLTRSRLLFRAAGLQVSTAGTRDSYYSVQSRRWHEFRECIAILAFYLEKPIRYCTSTIFGRPDP